jgi:hypothetical protein
VLTPRSHIARSRIGDDGSGVLMACRWYASIWVADCRVCREDVSELLAGGGVFPSRACRRVRLRAQSWPSERRASPSASLAITTCCGPERRTAAEAAAPSELDKR